MNPSHSIHLQQTITFFIIDAACQDLLTLVILAKQGELFAFYYINLKIILCFDRGVGTGKIIGRVHMAQMKLGTTFFPVSITILESSDVEFLLGLDMLKRHRCSIDLGKNVLRIEGHYGSEEISFF